LNSFPPTATVSPSAANNSRTFPESGELTCTSIYIRYYNFICLDGGYLFIPTDKISHFYH
jgi:hypothetical protein